MALTKDQITTLLELINSSYPNNKYVLSPALINTWQMAIGHYDMATLQAAIAKTIANVKYPPTCADINLEMRALYSMGLPSEGEAWAAVDDAKDYHDFADYSPCDAHVPPIVAEAVRLIGGWPAIDYADNKDVIRGQFIRFYRELKERTIERGITSPQIQGVAARLDLQVQGQIAEGNAITTIRRAKE